MRTEAGGIAAPVVGFVVDRAGVRRLMVVGVWIVPVGFVLLSRVDSLLTFYGAVIVSAIGGSLTGGAISTVAIAHWFRRRRGRALGLMTFGRGVTAVTAVGLAWLIASFGWVIAGPPRCRTAKRRSRRPYQPAGSSQCS